MNTMIAKRPGEIITFETRGLSHESVDKRKRQSEVLEIFKSCDELGATAKECAALLHLMNKIPSDERNYTAPRITELCQMGVLEPIGKKKCQYTGKTVTVFYLTDNWEECWKNGNIQTSPAELLDGCKDS